MGFMHTRHWLFSGEFAFELALQFNEELDWKLCGLDEIVCNSITFKQSASEHSLTRTHTHLNTLFVLADENLLLFALVHYGF